jgi:NAD(P)H-hydrate epimerase
VDRSLEDNAEWPERLTRDQLRAVDRYAIGVCGVPGVVLMENAGLNAAGAAVDLLRREFVIDEDSARVTIVCGGGNNGGDGYVIARHLLGWGLRPAVVAVKAPKELTGDAATMCQAWTGCGGEIFAAERPEQIDELRADWARQHLLIDAVLGSGFSAEHGPLREPQAAAIGAMNAAGERGAVKVLAVDLPSGLDCDTGISAEPCGAVRADLTVSFVGEKVGFGALGSAHFIGQVVLADIGLPAAVVARALADPERI